MGNIITISREFGSGGRYIGHLLAEKLGYKYYDNEIITKVAEETGFVEEYIAKKGEYAPSGNMISYSLSGRNSAGFSVDDTLFKAQYKIITDISKTENAVIIGRSADYILRDEFYALHVFIYGDVKEKVERIMKLHKVSEKEALSLMKEMDKKRAVNYKYYTGRKWGNWPNYDLMINSSTLGYERSAEIIASAVEEILNKSRNNQ